MALFPPQVDNLKGKEKMEIEDSRWYAQPLMLLVLMLLVLMD